MTIDDIKEQGLLLFECISGSKAYATDVATSDTDLKGVYYLPRKEFFGLNYIAQVSNDSNDEVYYELGRFVDLLIKNNPNILEMLASPADCVVYKHPIMEHLRIEMFLSKRCKDTFAGYAITQIRKAKGLKKKIVNPFPKEKLSALDFCFIADPFCTINIKNWLNENGYRQENCGLVSIPHSKGLYALFYDSEGNLNYRGIIKSVNANEVSLSSVPAGAKESGYLFFNIDGYSSYCKQYKEYWDWVENRNEDRYNNNVAHGKDYDSKNMMHTIRLLQMTEEILSTGRVNVRRPNRAELLDIRSGKFSYAELLKKAESLIISIEKAYEKSLLPELTDYHTIENILINMRAELYSVNK